MQTTRKRPVKNDAFNHMLFIIAMRLPNNNAFPLVPTSQLHTFPDCTDFISVPPSQLYPLPDLIASEQILFPTRPYCPSVLLSRLYFSWMHRLHVCTAFSTVPISRPYWFKVYTAFPLCFQTVPLSRLYQLSHRIAFPYVPILRPYCIPLIEVVAWPSYLSSILCCLHGYIN